MALLLHKTALVNFQMATTVMGQTTKELQVWRFNIKNSLRHNDPKKGKKYFFKIDFFGLAGYFGLDAKFQT